MLVTVPEEAPTAAQGEQPEPARRGYSQRRAGLGVLTVTRDAESRRRIVAWKLAADEDGEQTAALADELAALVNQALPVRPSGCVLTIPPQGASWPGPYYARLLARRVATRLALPLVEMIERTDAKHYHGPHAALEQTPCALKTTVPAAIVLDDLITSGRTMALMPRRAYGRQKSRLGVSLGTGVDDHDPRDPRKTGAVDCLPCRSDEGCSRGNRETRHQAQRGTRCHQRGLRTDPRRGKWAAEEVLGESIIRLNDFYERLEGSRREERLAAQKELNKLRNTYAAARRRPQPGEAEAKR